MKASVIISARNEAEHIEITLRSLLSSTDIKEFEIIVVNDASTDRTEEILGKLKLPNVKTLKTKALGTARARNLGARFAKGSLFIFSDAHNLFPDKWLEKILKAQETTSFDILATGITADKKGWGPESGTATGFGQRLNEKAETKWIVKKPSYLSEVPIAAGGFTVFKPEVFKSIEGYDSEFFSWGYEDVEISVKAWLRGYSIKVMTDIVIEHFFRLRTPYKIDFTAYYYNYYRTAILHFNEQRINKMKDALHQKLLKASLNPEKSFQLMEQYLIESKAYEKRNRYFKTRKNDDNWFFDKFNIDF